MADTIPGGYYKNGRGPGYHNGAGDPVKEMTAKQLKAALENGTPAEVIKTPAAPAPAAPPAEPPTE